MEGGMLNAPIILLREGTDTSQGKPQIAANIAACGKVCDILRTTLGPLGMDKLIKREREVTITNDGATVMDSLDVVHPAAKILVDVAAAQDADVGDGTTSVVLLSGELLQESRVLMDDGLHPLVIAKGFKQAAALATSIIKDIQISISGKTPEERREMLELCAKTALNSKIVASHRDLFARMSVAAVAALGQRLEKDMIGIKKVSGGSITDSFLVDGVAFKKTFSYAGFEQQPKNFISPKILLLNLELELKAEKDNAEIRIERPQDYQSIVDAEWRIIFNKLEAIVDVGANVVLSKQPIGDVATQFFADRHMFCAGRVDPEDLKRTAKATGAQIQTTVRDLRSDVLGTCGSFEEMQLGSERFNIFKGCPGAKTATVVIRGGATQMLEEIARSLNDSIEVVRRTTKAENIVGGGGATEMHLSSAIRKRALELQGKMQIVFLSFARALEVIPRTLAQNSGLDSTNILNQLRMKHNKEVLTWAAVDCVNGEVCDAIAANIIEPSLVKINAISSATEAACLILSVDETVKNPKSNKDPDGPNAM